MRIKIMPMLFMTLAIFSMTMLANNPVLAQPEDAIDLSDDYCTPSEKALQLCYNVPEPDDYASGYASVDYVVQVQPDVVPARVLPEDFDPDTFNLNWPIRDPIAGTTTFQYRAFVSPTTDCVKVDTWNYFVLREKASIAEDLLSTVPTGAQLLLPGDSVTKCRDFVAEEDEYLLKNNPALNCSPGNEVTFSYTYIGNVVIGLNNESVIATKSGCESGFLLGASPGTIPFHAEQKHTFPLGGSVDVKFNPLSSGGGEDLVESVKIDGIERDPEDKAWICTPVPEGSEGDYIVPIPGFGLMRCFEPEKAGLQNVGCVIDANPRTYLFGGDVYTGR